MSSLGESEFNYFSQEGANGLRKWDGLMKIMMLMVMIGEAHFRRAKWLNENIFLLKKVLSN